MNGAVREVQVARLVYDEASKAPVIVLREVEGDRLLPIWIGHPEANAIALALESIQLERPMTHDLLKNIIEGLGGKVTKVVVNALKGNTYHARIIIETKEGIYSFDARPSDSIALALRVGAPIYAAEEVLARSEFREEEEE